VYKFILGQLRKRYIRLLRPPQTILVFFVEKKYGKKRMVQDYQYLNEWIENYPLPLIFDVIENIRTKKIFIKMDLRWGYNNMKIKKRDKWKVAFIILKGSFEPMVMFFGLKNLLAIFQAMMNKLLRDLINIEKLGNSIDNIMVGTEMKEGHDKLVAEILKRLEENNLYVKPEKYKWKVREVDFLEVVIRPEEIKMEKVKAVLDLPVPKLVKDI